MRTWRVQEKAGEARCKAKPQKMPDRLSSPSALSSPVLRNVERTARMRCGRRRSLERSGEGRGQANERTRRRRNERDGDSSLSLLTLSSLFPHSLLPPLPTLSLSTHTYIHTHAHTHIHTHIDPRTHTYTHIRYSSLPFTHTPPRPSFRSSFLRRRRRFFPCSLLPLLPSHCSHSGHSSIAQSRITQHPSF